MKIESLATTIRACTLCQDLPLGPRPLLQVHRDARVLIAGQAPGKRAHLRGVPFDDPSGNRLRDWLGIDRTQFYDARKIAIVPMAFCWPGTGRSGDLPPRTECAKAWRSRVLQLLPNIRLTIVIGRYAMDWHLDDRDGPSVGAVVAAWRRYWPDVVPLPHPSPRNARWLRRHPFFACDVLPQVRTRLHALLR